MADYTIPNLNESVALGIQPPTPTAASNPLTMLQGMTELQSRMNQIKLFNEQMLARQRAGEIMANAPDNDAAMATMSRDPQVAGYMPEMLNTLRQLDLTNAQLQGVRQGQGDTAIHAIMQTIPSAMTDLSSFDNMMKSRLSTLPASIRDQVKDSVGYIRGALFDGLPEDPAQKAAAYNKRWNAMMIGGGFQPDQIAGITGTAKIQDMGGYQQPGVQMPGVLGGAFEAAPGALGKTLAPTTVTGPYGPGGAQTTRVIGGGVPYTPLGGNPLTSGTPSNPPPASGGGGPARSAASGGTSAGGGNALTGPSMVQTGYNEHRGPDVADYEKSLDDRVNNGATLRKNVGEVVDAMKTATTGGGAQAYAKMGQALQALGVKNETVDKWANGSLAASQVVDKIALQNSMAQLKQQLTGVGGSRLNAQEFVAYLNKNPNLLTDPRAALQIFNLWNQFYDRDKTEQAMFDKFKAGEPTGDKSLDKIAGKNRDPGRWPALWNQSDYMSSFAPGGEISSAGVKGLGGSGFSKEDQALLDRYLKAKK